MYRMPGTCPVCAQEMHVVRLQCPHCGTAVEGEFLIPPLARLPKDLQEFVEIFLRAEGKLNRVQEILGISYPTARARLQAVVRALGYEMPPEPPVDTSPLSAAERQAILEDVASGRLTVDEAIRRLQGHAPSSKQRKENTP